MSIIQENLNIETLQLNYDKTSDSDINPSSLIIFNNSLNRAYIRADLSKIDSCDTLKSAILSIPILKSCPQECKLMVFLVMTNESSLINILHKGISNKNIVKHIHNCYSYSNSFVSIDLKEDVELLIKKGYSYLELLILTEKMDQSRVVIRNQILDNKGISMNVSYNNDFSCNMPTQYLEKTFIVNSNSIVEYTPSVKAINLSKVSIFVTNKGNTNIKVRIEDSLDREVFIPESEGIEIVSGESEIIVPYYYSKYFRVKIMSHTPNINAVVNILGVSL